MHTGAHTQRLRPRAKLGDSACSSPATVYYDALESVESEDEGATSVCPGPFCMAWLPGAMVAQCMALLRQQPLQ